MSVEGFDETLAAFDRLGDVGRREAGRAVEATAQKVRTDAIRAIQRGQKSGRIYRRGGDMNLSTTHRASAPGQAPATDTGALVRSINARGRSVSWEVFSPLSYSYWLEYGTLHMAARPFLHPALRDNELFLNRQLDAAMERATEAFNQ